MATYDTDFRIHDILKNSLSCPGFFRMDNSGRLFAHEGIYQKYHTCKNERDAQDLSHIQGHRFLKSHLRLLDEFYQETHAKEYDKEDAYKCSPIDLFQLILVHPKKNQTKEQIAESLVKLCRMFRLSLTAKVEDKAPREASHIAINL